MSSIDVLDARRRLVDVGLCGDQSAEPAALLLDDLFDQALTGYVQQTTLDGLVDQWRAERAEIAAQQAQFLADLRKEINEFREENNQRERERDERERQSGCQVGGARPGSGHRRRQDASWVMGVVGLGFAAVGDNDAGCGCWSRLAK